MKRTTAIRPVARRQQAPIRFSGVSGCATNGRGSAEGATRTPARSPPDRFELWARRLLFREMHGRCARAADGRFERGAARRARAGREAHRLIIREESSPYPLDSARCGRTDFTHRLSAKSHPHSAPGCEYALLLAERGCRLGDILTQLRFNRCNGHDAIIHRASRGVIAGTHSQLSAAELHTGFVGTDHRRAFRATGTSSVAGFRTRNPCASHCINGRDCSWDQHSTGSSVQRQGHREWRSATRS